MIELWHPNAMDFKSRFASYIKQVEQGLIQYVPAATTRPSRLHEAMRYSLDAGGKRLRPVLALASAELFGADARVALPAAVAIECIHTYSLIHDDLPCMDNDDLRRGRPTAHKAFDEATALLAGDALLTHAFHLLGTAYAQQASLTVKLLCELGDAAGSRRLIGGQMADLLAEHSLDVTVEELEFIHLNKTAAMIEASLVMGGYCGGASDEQAKSLRQCGRLLGLAFQVIDDILDVTSTSEVMGKTVGKDLKADKTTYVKLHGLERAREIARQLTQAATQAAQALPGDTRFLTTLIEEMGNRLN